jgi:aspartate carbamoyltransferase regulatory subunit
MKFKDLIKIQSRYLTEKESHDIAVFAPQATINIIKNYKIHRKISARLPHIVERILVCPNFCCITNQELVDTRFLVEEHKQKVFLRCAFCEKIFAREEIKDYKP